jgi:DNA segregation ATPase FtsK/SpoIIIE, S-DNA-T family
LEQKDSPSVEHKKHEILGLCLLVMALLILLSLLSFHRTDLTVFNASAVSRAPLNWIGAFGANLAWGLIFLAGIGAYWLPVTALWATYAFLRGHKPFFYDRWQVMGTLLLMISSVTLVSLYSPRIQLFHQEIFSGGQVGLILASFLKRRFDTLGTYILTIGVLITGLILATPFSLRAAAQWLRSGWNSLSQGFGVLLQRFNRSTETDQIVTTPPAREPVPRTARSDSGSKPAADIPLVITAPPSEKAPQASTRIIPGGIAGGEDHYELPPLDLLDTYETKDHLPDRDSLEANAHILEEKLADFGVQGQVVGINPGPVITMYEYAPAPGIKISRVVNLSDDLAMALKAISIRVVAPIPGKAAIGIEIPNQHRQPVSLRAVLESRVFSGSSTALTIALGKDIVGQPAVANLGKMPHLLIAGATGTGKSVCINALLCSVLFRNTPNDVRLLLIDPKRIELNSYEGIPHLLHPVVTDAKMATRALRWAVQEMELRYKLLADKGVRNIETYNKVLAKEQRDKKSGPIQTVMGVSPPAPTPPPLEHHHLPYLVLFIDELADLMMVASREVEESIIRLAQMARAAGIHLVLATQRPSVDVLTGIIKANIPTRISFQVSSRVDSRTILDANGAESLLGSGDMLFLPPGTGKLQRIHGAFVSENEVQRITQFWRDQELPEDPLVARVNFEDPDKSDEISEDDLDEKYQEAIALVMETRQASISMLQRRLRVGYNRAARMIEIMEQQGVVGPSDGVKPREVYGSGRRLPGDG